MMYEHYDYNYDDEYSTHFGANQQNMHILDSQINANKAVHKLMRMGITVIEVYIGLVQPIIIVQDTSETKKLTGVITRTINRDGVHRAIYQAEVNDCRVEWESGYVH